MVKPGLVNHEDPSSYHRGPGDTEKEGGTVKWGNRSLSSGSRSLPAETPEAGGLGSSQGLTTSSYGHSPLCFLQAGLRAQAESAPKMDALEGPSDETPSKEPPRPLAQEGRLPREDARRRPT